VGRAFGPHLRTLRERAALSQGDLAGERYDRSFIAKLEAGASLPSVEAIGELASALGLSPRALIPKEL
jgi:transcriptional regulator with XRE-family HTH domain